MAQKPPPDLNSYQELIDSLNAISGEPRSSVLISHLYLEYLIDWVLRKKLKKPDKIIKYRFSSKLEIVESLGVLSELLMRHLWVINEIRNLFAHRIDTFSTEFDSEFRSKLEKMEWYHEMREPSTIPSYPAYSLVMLRVYHTLYGEFAKM